MKRWMLLDYGVGNLHSLAKALAQAGAHVEVTTSAGDVARADIGVLPGVGAFGAVMQRVAPAAAALRERHAAKRPLLGICIGAQVMYAASSESPGVKGLGLFPATVQRLPASAGKIPHMGWNTLDDLQDPIFDGVDAGSYVYYVHGYAAPPGPETTATTQYGTVFTAALRQGATVGLQFHPEKSSQVGKRILANTVRILEGLA